MHIYCPENTALIVRPRSMYTHYWVLFHREKKIGRFHHSLLLWLIGSVRQFEANPLPPWLRMLGIK